MVGFLLCGFIAALGGSAASADTNLRQDAVLNFVADLVRNDREAAKALVSGMVNQTNQMGAIIPGGTYRTSTPFQMRVVAGKEEVSVAETFREFSSCALWKIENLAPDHPGNVTYQITYMCQPPMAVFFLVKAADRADKVSLFQFGHHPIFYSPPAGAK